jgi:hypothetical protein
LPSEPGFNTVLQFIESGSVLTVNKKTLITFVIYQNDIEYDIQTAQAPDFWPITSGRDDITGYIIKIITKFNI